MRLPGDPALNALAVIVVAAVLGAACSLLGGCHPNTPPEPPRPEPAPVPAGACQAAQETLDELRCPEAHTPGGAPFVEACEAAAEDGRSWMPQCIAGIARCDQVEDAAAGKVGCP